MVKKNDLNVAQKEKTAYAGLDVWKFLMAILVILIHCSLLGSFLPSNDEKWSELVKDISVTGFFCANGYFGFKSIDFANVSDRIKFWGKWRKNVYKYLIWSGIYFPLMIYGEFFVYKSSFLKGVLKLLRTIFLTGWHYYSWTLWYMLALVISFAIIGIFQKKIKSVYILFFSGVLYLIGAIIEQTYKSEYLFKIVQQYYELFYNTRNAFFYALFFVSFGMFLTKKKEKRKFLENCIYIVILVFSFLIFLFVDNWVIERICAAGICCSIFLIILNISLPKNRLWIRMRKASICLYFVHMYFVAFFELVVRKYVLISDLQMFAGVVLCSFVTAIAVEICTNKFNWGWLGFLF